MRNTLTAAVAFLATGTLILGLARPASAQTSAPVVSRFVPAIHSEPSADFLTLPRVVPPPRPAPPLTGHVVPASATTAKRAVDMLAVPVLWLAKPNPTAPRKLPVIPSALPSWVPAKCSPPLLAAPVRPVLFRPSEVAVARPPLHAAAVSKPATRVWPPAHWCEGPGLLGERGVAYSDVTPIMPAPPVKPK